MDARCYAYEPPGMLLTYEAAVYFDNFVLSTIFGDDMVPRCSRNSLEFLKLDVKHCLSTCQQPKYQVLGSALSNRFWNKRRKYRPRFSFKKPKWAIINNSNNNSSNNNQHQNTGTVTPDPAGNVEATSVAAAVAELERVSIELPELHQQQQPPVVMMSSPSLFVAGRILYIEKCRLWNDGKDGDLSWVNGQGNSSYSIFNRRASKTIDRVFTWNRKENNENNNNNTLHQQEHQVQIEEAEPQYGTHHFTTTHQHVHATTRNDIPITFLPKVEGKYAYCPRWAGREEFLTVIVSTSMVSDHWPLEILKQFELQPLGQELIAVQKLKKGLKP